MAHEPHAAVPEVVGLDDVELLGDEVDELVTRARELYLAGELAAAAAAFGEAAQLDPSSFDAAYGLSKALRRSDPAAARAQLDRALALRPGSFEAWRALGLLCAAERDAAGVERALAGAQDTGDPRATTLARDVAAVL
jgi:tetratricopeptide (TPR) repeat protein